MRDQGLLKCATLSKLNLRGIIVRWSRTEIDASTFRSSNDPQRNGERICRQLCRDLPSTLYTLTRGTASANKLVAYLANKLTIR